MSNKLLITAIAIASASFGSANAADLGTIDDFSMEERRYEGTHSSNMDIISSLWIGGAAFDSNSSDLDGDSLFKIGGDTRVNIGSSDGFSLQLEGLGSFSGSRYCDSCGDDSNALLNFQAGAHLIHRNSDSYAAGAFVSFSGTSMVSDNDAGHLIVGGELAGFFGNTTLVVQGGGAWDMLDSNSSWDDGWFVRGVGRYFVTPNSKVEAEIAYAGGDFDASDASPGDERAVTWGLEYEQQIGPMPLSGFAAYDGTHIEANGGGDYTENRFVVGLRGRFGEADMLAQDRGGAGTFDLYDIANISGVADRL